MTVLWVLLCDVQYQTFPLVICETQDEADELCRRMKIASTRPEGFLALLSSLPTSSGMANFRVVSAPLSDVGEQTEAALSVFTRRAIDISGRLLQKGETCEK